MLADEKILITGPAGQIGKPLAEFLARDNEVWGVARFREPATRAAVEALGVHTVAADLGSGELEALPRDFTYVLHLAAYREPGDDFGEAMRVNADGTGFLMSHCRRARAVLVMSTHAVYRPHPDPMHVYAESDPLGDANPPYARTYSISKIAQEAVATYCARELSIPTVIARMNASYGPNGGRAIRDLDQMLAGEPARPRWDPFPWSPIAQQDINEQTEALLDAAATTPLVVNWCGDDVTTTQEWCAHLARLAGCEPLVEVTPVEGTQRGLIADATLRRRITGPCRLSWEDGLRLAFEQRYGGEQPPVP